MNKEFDLSKYKTDDGILSGLPQGWREIATEMFRRGSGVKQVMVALNVSRRKHEVFMLEDDYFEIFDNGMILSEAFWMDFATTNMNEKTFNTALFNSMMNRMFKWDEKVGEKTKRKNEETKESAVQGYLDKYSEKQNKKQRLDA
jgi:hypothetical protein